jgi:hypothetical protein
VRAGNEAGVIFRIRRKFLWRQYRLLQLLVAGVVWRAVGTRTSIGAVVGCLGAGNGLFGDGMEIVKTGRGLLGKSFLRRFLIFLAQTCDSSQESR